MQAALLGIRHYALVVKSSQVAGNQAAALVVVSGLPGAGKTTLGAAIAGHLAVPFLSKDDLKIVVAETMPTGQSSCLSGSAYNVMYYVAREVLGVGFGVVIESNFDPQFDVQRIVELAASTRARAVQVHCRVDPGIALDRFESRMSTGVRPDLLNDRPFAIAWREQLSSNSVPDSLLPLPFPTVTVDTSDFRRVKAELVADDVRRSLAGQQ